MQTIWGIYGKVLNPKTNRYIRIGTPASMKAIYDLKHDNEWYKRVHYMIKNDMYFGVKLKNYLEKKGVQGL